MNELLKKDLTMKIISILIAVIIWFLAMDNVNPYITKNLNIPLTIQNETSLQDNNIAIKKEYVRFVGVNIKGREEKINNVTAADFVVKLDFSKVKNYSDKVLHLDGPFYIGKEDLSDSDIKIELNPKTVNLDLEPIEKNPFRVEINTTGIQKEGYQIIQKTTVPEIVSIQGPDSLLKTVAAVKVVSDVTGLDKDISFEQNCKVYDKNGNEIPQLSKDLNVKVNINVAKEVTVRPVIKGKPAPNFSEVSNIANPEKVLITGDPLLLSQITELSTEPINIEDIKGSLDLKGKIIVPYGVKLFSQPKEIEVSVKVEPLITKDFTIGKDQIDLVNTEIDNSLNYLIQTGSLIISIKGPESELNKLDLNSIKPIVDVFGLGEGTFTLPLKVNLPDTYKVTGDYLIEVFIQKRA